MRFWQIVVAALMVATTFYSAYAAFDATPGMVVGGATSRLKIVTGLLMQQVLYAGAGDGLATVPRMCNSGEYTGCLDSDANVDLHLYTSDVYYTGSHVPFVNDVDTIVVVNLVNYETNLRLAGPIVLCPGGITHQSGCNANDGCYWLVKKWGVCGLSGNTCSDGTALGSCSVNKPKYCQGGSLIDKCSVCGCPTGVITYTCAGGQCLGSDPCANAYCGDGVCTCGEDEYSCGVDCGVIDPDCDSGDSQSCTADNGCGGSQNCVNTKWGVCYTELTKCGDGQCRATCSTCYSNADCNDNNAYTLDSCVSGSCSYVNHECLNDNDCLTAIGVCEKCTVCLVREGVLPQKNVCVECVKNSDCSEGKCVKNKCVSNPFNWLYVIVPAAVVVLGGMVAYAFSRGKRRW